ncbi:hypothetical protein A3K34_02820 [candidate division WWE3 bacterium RIFOXYC1_FULL_40_10]|uniref:Uncharacterized protein n=1 Tax=candidate division WWE3 bacterium RIFOXYA2_FULL_46_9 TaxID=1802636 RepID=A0A1F4W0J8_UNCKA|nr:MAG: hypothetical protein A3K58_02820 [candidate division WWE3 bacterium RIFOXYB1_FULL_40_22]OGC61779.1 MAG: hypothetical protein A3K37_02820 [candidate division WWE3 bacterium RIFOXYA1_FULL_40_11]OGC62798.1 MAG: hypothetical protein A2264_03980 [candidate division WWE3 bacterium RIFOXYA2_FULL_46_9]OGC65172.1 MAG: hypothetical protein A2326_02330 [candidate division WWE3 bacterium RIFOXYB2_FULL_41_6]OGC66162.1 MAG: hypothetical protein A3K34_02820 [candidate division WWE3 bacterium RIFOXYC1_
MDPYQIENENNNTYILKLITPTTFTKRDGTKVYLTPGIELRVQKCWPSGEAPEKPTCWKTFDWPIVQVVVHTGAYKGTEFGINPECLGKYTLSRVIPIQIQKAEQLRMF